MSNREFGPRALGERFSLSCVVPVLNEGAQIARFLESLHHIIDQLAVVEIVVVNDGSTDNSAAEIAKLCERLPLRYLELSRNFGKETAIQAGLDVASGDCIVIMDADFQHPISLIASMIERWRAGVDMVYAVKADRKSEGWLRRFCSVVFYRLLMPRGPARVPPDAGDFRLLDRKVVNALRAMPERNRFMKGMYAWVGFKSEAIEMHIESRASGRSKFKALKLAGLAITGITAFSNAPLRVVTGVGMLTSILSIGMGTWIVFEKLYLNQPIPGFATLAAAIFFFAGIQLVALGVVGEYVGRIFNEVKQRPQYVIASEINRSPLAAGAAASDASR
jgi:glycosyltransferase involved in cell wall biosynthesis